MSASYYHIALFLRDMRSPRGANMDVILSVRADTLSPDALQDLTREICRTLNQETDVQASLLETPTAPGAKGPWESLGQILVHVPWDQIAVHGAGVVAGETVILTLKPALKPFYDKIKSLKIGTRGADGKEHTITAEGIKPNHEQQTKK